MDTAIESIPGMLRVKRDGPRGWHWIAASSYDPALHVLMDSKPEPVVKATRGRPKKSTES